MTHAFLCSLSSTQSGATEIQLSTTPGGDVRFDLPPNAPDLKEIDHVARARRKVNFLELQISSSFRKVEYDHSALWILSLGNCVQIPPVSFGDHCVGQPIYADS